MVKLELRDRVEDGALDLSMSQLEEVPLKEMIPIKHKVKRLDLSNNQLTTLQPTFASQMVLLVELDLSKNQLTEVPENFGLLINLMHLDLYSNKIERLPLSFKDLTKLRWLDLKDNPLTPQLAKIAGPCVDQADCQKCAREVVLVMQEIGRSIEEKKLQKAEDRQQGAPKEKKKKKKSNKGGAGGAGGDKSANVTHDAVSSKLSEQQVRESVEKTKSRDTSKINGETPSGKCKAPLPLRLCCAITRALVWSLILVGLFLGTLYLLSLPELRPYADKALQQYQLLQSKIIEITGDMPDKLNVIYESIRNSATQVAVWSQNFMTKDLPVYLDQTKVIVLDFIEKVKTEISQWMNSTKKD